jgi:hypothetical protein
MTSDTGLPQGDSISAPAGVPTNKVDDPEFWRSRAEVVRTIVADMKVGEARSIMTGIAQDYERIAQLVEQWLRERKPKPMDVFEALGPGRPLSKSD